ncbi:MAG: lipopolysaccharide transport periplasmic protein LptA [Thermodesulfobacteriota bacterium]|nr:lipopolysaccharide transport periplasmic protein LptA [Thermodesulfobacteriota bacterium]
MLKQVVKKVLTPFCFLVVLFYTDVANTREEEKIVANVAIIPFKAYSSEEDAELKKKKVIILLSEVISENKNILVLPDNQVKKLISSLKFYDFDRKNIETISSYLKANFVIYGSFTSLGKNLSLDVRIFNNFGRKKIVKAYEEGKDFNLLVQKIGKKLREIIINNAGAIPIAKRPDQEKQEIISRIFPEELPPVTQEKGIPEERKELTEILRDVEKKELIEEDIREEKGIPKKPEQIKKKEPLKAKRGRIVTPGFFSLDKPIDISSESMEADNIKNVAVFRGNVSARQKDMSAYSKEMIVYYDVKGGIKKIVAIGNVRIKQKNRIVSSERAVFANKERQVILTGNPRIWEGEDMISGEKIIVFLDQDKIIVEGSKKNRVKAVVTPRGAKR